MSNADRRKEQKARKQRLIKKKQAQAQERLEEKRDALLAWVRDDLRDKVDSGVARFALCTVPHVQVILAAMWTKDGAQVASYDARQEASISMLADAGIQHVGAEEWIEFFGAHMRKVMEVDDDQLAITLVPWKPGEGPLSAKIES